MLYPVTYTMDKQVYGRKPRCENLGRKTFASKQVIGDDGCIQCRCSLLQIIVCEYDAIICELLCKVSWYTLQFIHIILGLMLHSSDFAVVV